MRFLRNSRGQFLIETVLMMTIMVGLFVMATAQLREGQFLAKLVGGPWQQLSGMIESGVWDTADKARSQHPNATKRSLSLDPREGG